MNFRRIGLFCLIASFFISPTVGCKPSGQNKLNGTESNRPEFSFVTNGTAAFWNHAEAGCQKAGEDFDVAITFQRPKDAADQVRILEDLVTRGTKGISVTAMDPVNQTELLNKVAAKTLLITHDSDAPESNRLVYIGMDNYQAGWKAGELVRKALPEGGEVALFIGLMDQDNSKLRRQGCIDAILGRKPDNSRRDTTGTVLKSKDEKFIILGTLIDGYDIPKSKAQAEDTLNRNPNIAAMVGLWEYNPPAIIEALDQAGMLGKVKIIGFDENEATLQGIQDGTVVGTVVQDPYMYGYKSIELLNQLHQGNKNVIPKNKFLDIPARVIDASNVEEFWKVLKERLVPAEETN